MSIVQVDEELLLQEGVFNDVSETVKSDVSPSKILSGSGNETGLRGVLTNEGEVLVLKQSDEAGNDHSSLKLRRCVIDSLTRHKDVIGQPLHHLVVAGNGKVCASFGQ